MKSSLFSAVLFSVEWMSVMVTGEGPLGSDCCLTVTNTRIPVENIEDYYIQESTSVCSLRAVRFLTKKGIYICSDPDDSWAIRVLNYLNKRKNKEPSVETTSATKMIPTTAHKSHDHPDCCLTVTNTRTDEDIVDYHIQDSSLCPIRAVRFITVENNTICSSLAEEWVQDYIQNLNRRKTSTDTLQLDGLSEEEKQTSEINHPYSNNNEYFCLKKEPVQYFCIKQS